MARLGELKIKGNVTAPLVSLLEASLSSVGGRGQCPIRLLGLKKLRILSSQLSELRLSGLN